MTNIQLSTKSGYVKNSYLVQLVLFISLMAVYVWSEGFDLPFWFFSFSWIFLFLILEVEGIKSKSTGIQDYIFSLQLSALALFVGGTTDYSPLLMVIPVFIGLLMVRQTNAYFVPAGLSLIAALAFSETQSFHLCLLWALSGLLCFGVNRFLNQILVELSDKVKALSRVKELSETHLKIAGQIAEGQIVEGKSIEEKDELGRKFLDLSLDLRKSAENERVRSWQMSGLNELGEIVRAAGDQESEYQTILSFLVKYLMVNQGGLFVINEEDPDNAFIELKASYAYGRQKFNQKKVGLKEGLLGQSFLERDTIYLEVIPENYVHITSGLGEATPSSLIIVPLIQGEEIYGMIELASFETFKEHEKEFLKKAAEIIGGAIAGFKISAYTHRMLTESQQLTQELKAQEEEMRQNLEEMEAIQEQIQREAREREKLQAEISKSREFLNLVLDSIPVPVFAKDREHKMILVNKAVCELNNLSREQMLGKSDYDFFSKEEAEVFWNFEEEIFKEMKVAEKVEYAIRNGKETYMLDKKLAIQTDDGECFLVGINIDVTDSELLKRQKEQEN